MMGRSGKNKRKWNRGHGPGSSAPDDDGKGQPKHNDPKPSVPSRVRIPEPQEDRPRKRKSNQKCPINNCGFLTRRMKRHLLSHFPSFFRILTCKDRGNREFLCREQARGLRWLATTIVGERATPEDLVRFVNRRWIGEQLDIAPNFEVIMRTLHDMQKWPSVFSFSLCPLNSPATLLHWRPLSFVLNQLTDEQHQQFFFYMTPDEQGQEIYNQISDEQGEVPYDDMQDLPPGWMSEEQWQQFRASLLSDDMPQQLPSHTLTEEQRHELHLHIMDEEQRRELHPDMMAIEQRQELQPHVMTNGPQRFQPIILTEGLRQELRPHMEQNLPLQGYDPYLLNDRPGQELRPLIITEQEGKFHEQLCPPVSIEGRLQASSHHLPQEGRQEFDSRGRRIMPGSVELPRLSPSLQRRDWQARSVNHKQLVDSETSVLVPDLEGFDSHFHPDRLVMMHGKGSSIQDILETPNRRPAHPIRLVGGVLNYCYPKDHDQVSLDAGPAWKIALGVHPKMVSQLTIQQWERFEELLAHPKVTAIGEVGLDYTAPEPTWQKQERFLRRVLKLGPLGFVLVLHLKGSDDESIGSQQVHTICRNILLEVCSCHQRIHLHNFSGDQKQMKAWVDAFPNCYFGFSGEAVSSVAQVMAIKAVPSNRLLLETDSPNYNIHPGMEINSPAYLGDVGELLANIRGKTSLSEIMAITLRNAKQLYGE